MGILRVPGFGRLCDYIHLTLAAGVQIGNAGTIDPVSRIDRISNAGTLVLHTRVRGARMVPASQNLHGDSMEQITPPFHLHIPHWVQRSGSGLSHSRVSIQYQ